MAGQSLIADDYMMLKDVRVELNQVEESFSFCMWIYLMNFFRVPATIIRQMQGDEDAAPFVMLNEDKKITIFPLIYFLEEVLQHNGSFLWKDWPCAYSDTQCPLEKWIHVGCEVSRTSIRLHINGRVAAEKLRPCSVKHVFDCHNFKKITLIGHNGLDGQMDGYVHYVQVLPLSSSVADHFVKDPPVKLTLDDSCITENHELEDGGDGVWNIVGGKASCRRTFILDVLLVNAFGCSIHQEMELMASLVYADNGFLVEKAKDTLDAPLLVNHDGVEYPSSSRAVKLLHGRASFKLKISQLSSKCDGRLFRVCFYLLKDKRYPFLEISTRPICCISRNRPARISSVVLKKSSSSRTQLNGAQLHVAYERLSDIQTCQGDDNLKMLPANNLKQPFSPKRFKREETLEKLEVTDNTPSDSESVHARSSTAKWKMELNDPISDAVLFKYCLGGMPERSSLLREIVSSASDLDMEDFAQQVALYTGCSHQRKQILMSKRLIHEGIEAWSSIPGNTHDALWKNVAWELRRRFLNISHSSRGLSAQDIELLHRMAGSCNSISRETFDRIWVWFYPVAYALSGDRLNALWEHTSPRWIEGLISTEVAEASLKGPEGVQPLGTFVLRFPTSRSWPHPDAGSLVVSYVGADQTIHHRLLSLHDRKDRDRKPLEELLLAESVLSHPARVARHDSLFFEVGSERFMGERET